MIYADNAATTKIDPIALDVMISVLKEQYANPSQPYSFAQEAKKQVEEARATIANCINAYPEEIFFTSGGTESDNWAIKNYGMESLITSSIEHHAILNAAEFVARQGSQVTILPVDKNGYAETNILGELLEKTGAKLVSVMCANNEIGSIQDIKGISNIVHEYDALFHSDAVQAVGHIKVDVKAMGIDMLSASAHKFNGPKGIGFMYIKNGVNKSSFICGGAQENNLRAGTENVASIVGMAVALKNNIQNIDEHQRNISLLETRLIDRLNASKIDFLKNGGDNKLPGNISLSFKGYEGEAILHRLDLKGICVSTGSACDSKRTQISHVIKAIGLDREYAEGTIRISLGKDNTVEEIDYIADSIISIVGV